MFILFLLLSFTGFSQEKNSVRVGLRLFREADNPVSMKRKLPKNEYAFNMGLGFRIKYLRNLSNRVSIGLETGSWYFINNNRNIDLYNREYLTRNMVTPLMAVVHLNVFRRNLNWLSVGLKGGGAYLQNIHKLNDNSQRIVNKWTSIAEISLSAQLVIRRMPYHFGYGCNLIEGKYIRGVYIDYPAFEF